MDVYSIPFEMFGGLRPWPFNRMDGLPELNQAIAAEVTAALKKASEDGRKLMVICPVGPLDYSCWAELFNREQIDGSTLITINMDEYLDDNGRLVPESHPLSFRRFMREGLFDRLKGRARVPPENIYFPSPDSPEKITRLIEEHGGADLCYGGLGLTGHFAFNDPPLANDPCDDDAVRGSRTRVLEIGSVSMAQMCMGGTCGNWEVIPRRAVTLGMYELLLSKTIHLTFMRSWHAGVLRRALFGPVTGRCPGSLIQNHPNVKVTLTSLAAKQPIAYVAQIVGE